MRKTLSLFGVILFGVVTAAPACAHHMAVVVSKQNPVTSITSAELGRVFRGETKRWPDGKSIQLVVHRSSSGEAETLERLNKMSAQEWHRWVAGHKDLLVLADSDDDVLNYVEHTPGAIGLVEVHSLDDRVVVVRVDGKVPMEAGYLPH